MTNLRAPSKIIPRAFPGIKPDEIEELIKNSQVHAYAPGAVLCRENAVEDRFYMILEGDAEVTKIINNSEMRLLKTLGPGDFFGEMALIHNAPRAATVTAKTALTALELEKTGFDRVLHSSSSIAMAMVSEISNRLRSNDQMAVDDLRLRASELAEAYQKLAEQDLARREFLSNVAHELRTPLMAASGYLQMLQKGVMSGDQLNTGIEAVARNVQQIVSLVNDILFLQEMDLVLPEFQKLDLNTVAKNVADKYAPKAVERNVNLRFAPNISLPHAFGDSKSLERALSALVDNAIKFSPKGGDVDVRLSARGEEIFLAVEDHGIGIEKEKMTRVFDRFYHLERHENDLFGGIGLGLAITKQVIEQHQGKLTVTSAPGRGSAFTIVLKKLN
ncbi:MAG TPA: ATP-binding protein [Anaerolineales bacterium]|nr:cyclic nucleotide-binding domain-containing protein [Anaerolineales bacterium]HNQ94131.1 ATP-binding protein [Anaerolineales bacterium]HNS61494.1 ATP-binding protein [Anaerolineales bacterium]